MCPAPNMQLQCASLWWGCGYRWCSGGLASLCLARLLLPYSNAGLWFPPTAFPLLVLLCCMSVRLCQHQRCAWGCVMRGATATRLGCQTPIARACVRPASTALLGSWSASCAHRGTRVTPDPRRPPSSCASGATTVLQAPVPPRGTSATRGTCVQKVAVQARHY